MRRAGRGVLEFFRNFELFVSLWERIRPYLKTGLSTSAAGLVGSYAMTSFNVITTHWPAFVFGAVSSVFGILSLLELRDRRRIERARQDVRSFDIHIADAIKILIAATPQHGWPSEYAFEDYVFKRLHRYMCEGELGVAGSTGALEKIHPIQKTKCQSLIPAVALAPKGRVIHWMHSELDDKFHADEVYMNLRVRSEDLYRIWPHAKRGDAPND